MAKPRSGLSGDSSKVTCVLQDAGNLRDLAQQEIHCFHEGFGLLFAGLRDMLLPQWFTLPSQHGCHTHTHNLDTRVQPYTTPPHSQHNNGDAQYLRQNKHDRVPKWVKAILFVQLLIKF